MYSKDTPADIIEYGFCLAYQRQAEFHVRWRNLHLILQGLRDGNTPHDAGDHDAYFDCFLRQLEDEQAAYIADHDRTHPESRTKLQIQLTRYWLTSVGELFRTTRNCMDKEHELFPNVQEMVNSYGAFRMPISKQEVQKHHSQELDRVMEAKLSSHLRGRTYGDLASSDTDYVGKGKYRVSPVINTETGSVCFPVFDAKVGKLIKEDRRSLSDRALKLFQV